MALAEEMSEENELTGQSNHQTLESNMLEDDEEIHYARVGPHEPEPGGKVTEPSQTSHVCD